MSRDSAQSPFPEHSAQPSIIQGIRSASPKNNSRVPRGPASDIEALEGVALLVLVCERRPPAPAVLRLQALRAPPLCLTRFLRALPIGKQSFWSFNPHVRPPIIPHFEYITLWLAVPIASQHQTLWLECDWRGAIRGAIGASTFNPFPSLADTPSA